MQISAKFFVISLLSVACVVQARISDLRLCADEKCSGENPRSSHIFDAFRDTLTSICSITTHPHKKHDHMLGEISQANRDKKHKLFDLPRNIV
jgi:hypothetical protein